MNEKPSGDGEAARRFLDATDAAADHFPEHEPHDFEDGGLDSDYDYYPYNDDPVRELWEDWERDEEARLEHDMLRSFRGTWGALKPSQGIVRIYGRDELKLGMTCDVEHGFTRQAIEVEIVDINPMDRRLVTVERTDGKKWAHNKGHTRIVKP